MKRAMFRSFNTQKSDFSLREHLRTMIIVDFHMAKI